MAKKRTKDFMIMNNFIILISEEHPIHGNLEQVKAEVFTKEDIYNLPEADYIFDLTVLPQDEKRAVLTGLKNNFKGKIISELSVNSSEEFMEMVDGAIATAFYSPRTQYEVWAKDQTTYETIVSLFEVVGLKPLQVTSPGIGFRFPRILSQIINEAHFAFQDELASKKDIDTAMKYGVNYPMGPFEWTEKIGKQNIVYLLDELLNITKDDRYKACELLRED